MIGICCTTHVSSEQKWVVKSKRREEILSVEEAQQLLTENSLYKCEFELPVISFLSEACST